MWLRRCRQRLKKQKSGNDAAWRVFLVYNGNGYKKSGLEARFPVAPGALRLCQHARFVEDEEQGEADEVNQADHGQHVHRR